MMKRLMERAAAVLLMSAFALFLSLVFIGTVMVTAITGTGLCSQPVYEDVWEQVRDEAMIQGGLLCR